MKHILCSKSHASLSPPSHCLSHLSKDWGAGSGKGGDADTLMQSPASLGSQPAHSGTCLLSSSKLACLDTLSSSERDGEEGAWDPKELKFIGHLLNSVQWIRAFHLLVSWKGKSSLTSTHVHTGTLSSTQPTVCHTHCSVIVLIIVYWYFFFHHRLCTT